MSGICSMHRSEEPADGCAACWAGRKCERCQKPATAIWECGCRYNQRKLRCELHSLSGMICLSGDSFYKIKTLKETR